MTPKLKPLQYERFTTAQFCASFASHPDTTVPPNQTRPNSLMMKLEFRPIWPGFHYYFNIIQYILASQSVHIVYKGTEAPPKQSLRWSPKCKPLKPFQMSKTSTCIFSTTPSSQSINDDFHQCFIQCLGCLLHAHSIKQRKKRFHLFINSETAFRLIRKLFAVTRCP